jgi:hypothetical protein
MTAVARMVGSCQVCLGTGLAGVLLLTGCGGGGSTSTLSPTTSAGAAATISQRPPGSVAAVASVLRAVFEHPSASQCATAMTAHYLQQAFATDAANSGTTVQKACAEHQRARAALAASVRSVAIEGLTASGLNAQATLRGRSGYVERVLLVASGGTWRLDGIGPAVTPPGSGSLVAPSGSLYAYRIPSGLTASRVQIGSVPITGSAYSTGVAPANGRPGEGIVVLQTVLGPRVRDVAALKAQLPGVDAGIRGSIPARALTKPTVSEIGGRPAASWYITGDRSLPAYRDGEITLVFSSGGSVVVLVNCRWPRSGSNEQPVRQGCAAVLATLRVG